jgi:hypothetical protein
MRTVKKDSHWPVLGRGNLKLCSYTANTYTVLFRMTLHVSMRNQDTDDCNYFVIVCHPGMMVMTHVVTQERTLYAYNIVCQYVVRLITL